MDDLRTLSAMAEQAAPALRNKFAQSAFRIILYYKIFTTTFVFSFRLLLYFIPGVLLSPEPNVIVGRGDREKEYGTAVEEIGLRQAVAAVTIIIFSLLCIYLFHYVFILVCLVDCLDNCLLLHYYQYLMMVIIKVNLEKFAKYLQQMQLPQFPMDYVIQVATIRIADGFLYVLMVSILGFRKILLKFFDNENKMNKIIFIPGIFLFKLTKK